MEKAKVKDSELRSPWNSNHVGRLSTITIGPETGGNTINVVVQLKAENKKNLSGTGNEGAVKFYLSDNADGSTLITTAPSGGIAIGTDGLLIPFVANKAGLLVSENNGRIDINVVEAGAKTLYLILIMPSGRLLKSGAITFV